LLFQIRNGIFMAVMTALSGNEIYCLDKKGMAPGDLVIGNSVFSIGLISGIGSGLKMLAGGEVGNITAVIHEGRLNSYNRLHQEAAKRGGIGVTGVTNELVLHGSTVEFLSVGSCLHEASAKSEQLAFTSSASGQELYCQVDCGFRPIKFAFGNVAYSIGVGGGVLGGLKAMTRGEVPQFSQVFNQTRHLALERITQDAKDAGANCVVGIQTSIIPFRGIQEMVMLGTASHHPGLPEQFAAKPATSDLTNQEMWNLVHMGYMPIQLVLGVSVYALGLVGGVTAAFKSLSRGEISELTSLIYEARANAIAHITRDAVAAGADDVAGIKTYVYDLGKGLIEFMAIGTAVKYMPGISTLSSNLPCQAIIQDKDTFINTAERAFGANVGEGSATNRLRSPGKNKGPVTLWDALKILLKILGP
jgi:uncharacterized protein YbjQ (UPF0145 family)